MNCEPCISDLPSISIKLLTINEVVLKTCLYFKLDYKQVTGKRRERKLVDCRYMCFKFLRKNFKFTLSAIAKEFNRDHSTVLHGIAVMDNIIEVDSDYAYKFADYVKYMNQ